MRYEYLALGTAFLWAVTSLMHANLSKELGGAAYNRLRLTIAAIIMPIVAFFWGGWNSISWEMTYLIILSGIIGFSLGDTAMLLSMQKLGPRRTQILYSINAPMTLILAIVILSEIPTYIQFFGCVLAFIGVYVAIAYGRNEKNVHLWEQTEGKLRIGIMWGILSAFFQSVGLLLLKPALNTGADPFIVATIRITIAGIVIASIGYFIPNMRWKEKINVRICYMVVGTVVIGIVIAVGFFLTYAIKLGNIGIATILSATTPIMVLPLLWMTTKERPAIGAWIGAAISVIGVSIVIGS